MNIEEGQSYKVVFYIKSSGSIDVMISLTDEDEKQVLAFHRVMSEAHIARNWSKMEITLKSKASSSKSKLQLTTNHNGTIWLDQVSVMPYDTYKGHGFRKDLIDMVSGVGPRFLRFPGGIFSEGYVLSNAFRWKDTVGPWEKRPGHYSFWGYWSDDGLGFLEYLQLAEDLGAEPVWVVNSGISYKDEVKTSLVAPFVQEMLDGIEFARGSSKSRWGSLRAQLGHPQPFSLGFVEIGGGKCSHPEYKGNYLKFYEALKNSYPDIKVISNCDGSEKPLDHPADLYDLHTYATVSDMLELTHHFDKTKRDPRAPKAIVGEYASMYPLQSGTFEGALAEAAFLLSLERNSDVVEMVSYAPLLINRDQPHISWSPAAINFNSSKSFGIASYWVQTFFRESSGARLLKVDFYNQSKPSNLHITVIEWKNREEKKFMKIKVVNFNSSPSKLKFTFNTTEPKAMVLKKRKELASSDLQADNTPEDPTKVIPVSNPLDEEVGIDLDLKVEAHSFTAFDLINK